MGQLVVSPTEVTEIYQGNPTFNFGTNIEWNAGGDAEKAAWFFRALMYVDLSSIPTGATILSTSKLTGYCWQYSSYAHYIFRVTQTGWTENGATWNTYDGINAWATAGGDFHATIPSPVLVGNVAVGYVTILTGTGFAAFLQDALDNRSKALHMLMKQSIEANLAMKYYSDDYTTVAARPELTVDYILGRVRISGQTLRIKGVTLRLK